MKARRQQVFLMKKCKKQLTVFLSVLLLLAIAGGAVLHRKEK